MARKELAVQPREITGKKVVQLRRQGIVPGNIFGHNIPSVAVQLEAAELLHTIRSSTKNEVIDVTIGGERTSRPMIISKVQRHSLSNTILHADFYQVSLREKMRVEVPLVLTGTSEGVGTYGGNLLQALETLHIEALPLDIPPQVEIDVTPLATLESAIHVRDIKLPANVAILSDPELMVVKVESPRVSEEVAPAAEGAAAAAEEADEEK
jgi:large subunit ribosomal protein L25